MMRLQGNWGFSGYNINKRDISSWMGVALHTHSYNLNDRSGCLWTGMYAYIYIYTFYKPTLLFNNYTGRDFSR